MYPSSVSGISLDDKIPGSEYFKWREALYLPSWQIYCFPNQEQYQNVIKTAKVMDAIRQRLGKPIVITSWVRPKIYNAFIKGSLNSMHIAAAAVDFQVTTMDADKVREKLKGELERLSIRMEDLPLGSNWVHIDIKQIPVGSPRFFKP